MLNQLIHEREKKKPLGRPSCCNSFERVSTSTLNLTALLMIKAIAATEALTSEISYFATETSLLTLAYFF